MENKIKISEYELRKSQIGAHEYRISVFLNNSLVFQFNVALRPSGKDDLLPTYQPTEESTLYSGWINKNINMISDWIKNESR